MPGTLEVTDATTRLGGGWTASSTARRIDYTSRRSSRGPATTLVSQWMSPRSNANCKVANSIDLYACFGQRLDVLDRQIADTESALRVCTVRGEPVGNPGGVDPPGGEGPRGRQGLVGFASTGGVESRLRANTRCDRNNVI